MAMEEVLFNYGVLGVWTFVNLLTIKYYREKEEKRESKLIEVIEENIKVLTSFNENKKNMCCLK